jgi:putative FmdB family regulatory protein
VPTYSYACTECDNRFDAVQAFTEDALTTCPKCSGRLRKLFGNVGVVFKGSGFYRNDSRDTSKSTINGSSGESGSAASTEKSDKPAEKSTTSEKSDKPAEKSKPSSGSSDKSSSTSTGSTSKSSSTSSTSN